MQPTYLLPDNPYVLLGMAIVGIVSSNMFNSWTKQKSDKYGYTDQPRHYTTFMRFNVYRTIYILLMIAGYLVLLAFPDLLNILGTDISDDMAKKITDQSYLWAALIITGVVPNFPLLQNWEAKLRDKLQDYAFIPHEAKRIISILEDDYNAFQPEVEEIHKVLELINKDLYTVSDFTDTRMDSTRHKWCKLSYLYMMIEKRKAKRKFYQFIDSCDKLIHEKIEKGYSAIKEDIDERIKLIESHETNGITEPMVAPVKTETDTILTSLLSQCYQLISCGILTTEKLSQNRISAFEAFGLKPSSYTPAIQTNWDTIVKSSLVIFGSALIPTISYYYYFKYLPLETPPVIYPDNAPEALIWALVSLAMFVPGLIGATLIERLFWHQNRKKGKNPLNPEHRITHSFIAGCLGYGIGIAVLVLNSIFREGPLTAFKLYLFLFPMLPAISAALTVNFLEKHQYRYFRRIKRRAMETLTIGGGNVLVAFFIMLLLEKFDTPSMMYVILTAGVIGGSIGYVFIEEYRKHLRPEKERRQEHRYAVAENASLTLDDNVIDCQVVSITPSFATVNIDVPRDKTSARLKLGPIGEIPVSITRHAGKQTVLQFLLNKISETQLNIYLNKIKEGQPTSMHETVPIT